MDDGWEDWRPPAVPSVRVELWGGPLDGQVRDIPGRDIDKPLRVTVRPSALPPLAAPVSLDGIVKLVYRARPADLMAVEDLIELGGAVRFDYMKPEPLAV